MPRLTIYGGANTVPLYFSGSMAIPPDHPLSGRLKGKGGARIAIAMRPEERKMICVVFRRSSQVLTVPSDLGDFPDLRRLKPTTRSATWALLERMQSGIGPPDSLPEQRGRWIGTWQWGADQALEITLHRRGTTFTDLRITGRQDWEVHVDIYKRHFTQKVDESRRKNLQWLDEAMAFAFREEVRIVQEVSALKETIRRQAIDAEYQERRPVRLPKEPTRDPIDKVQQVLNPDVPATPSVSSANLGWSAEEMGHRHTYVNVPTGGRLEGVTREEEGHTHRFTLALQRKDSLFQVWEGLSATANGHSHRMRYVEWRPLEWEPFQIEDHSMLSSLAEALNTTRFTESAHIIERLAVGDGLDLDEIGRSVALEASMNPSLALSRLEKPLSRLLMVLEPDVPAHQPKRKGITGKATKVARWFTAQNREDIAKRVYDFTIDQDVPAFIESLEAVLDDPPIEGSDQQLIGLQRSLRNAQKEAKEQPDPEEQDCPVCEPDEPSIPAQDNQPSNTEDLQSESDQLLLGFLAKALEKHLGSSP